ncbi:ABC transporter ATP-binding protein [Massilia sp. BSC265]|uniref:ABC transporter ATP-binding protein n=1 Tax=Massilia sp. BSC265 TaxID=1549812 RepID=UPI0004E94537|nr:polyamine ABC transporter ATP-binding protein [Massilia sp. BSC265]KFI05683.1 transporter [Massilia sp. BSC265]
MAEHSQGNALPDNEKFLSIEGLTKTFDGAVTAVDNIHLSVRKGEIFALLGSSGCGKSTLLRMLAGFETPTSGRIMLAGRDIAALPPYERPINMMFQSYALFPHLTVWENIAFGLRRDGLPKREISERVEQNLRLVQLEQYARRKPHQLSGGQQQRVALARSLAKRPQLLLLDEPLGALDKKLREQTQLELVNIIQKVGVTCVMVTHDQEEAMTMASRIAIMSQGHFIQVGTPEDIYESPNCRFVADFIGSVNLFEGNVADVQSDHTLIHAGNCTIRVGRNVGGTRGAATGVALRPEKISISQHPVGQSHNTVPGTVEELSYYGNLTTFHVRLGDGQRVKVTHLNHYRHDDLGFNPGDKVHLHWSEDAMVIVAQ